jgi:hypothetical protein
MTVFSQIYERIQYIVLQVDGLFDRNEIGEERGEEGHNTKLLNASETEKSKEMLALKEIKR